MALINCPECNKEISDKADVCIHCGFPLKEQIIQNEKSNDTIINIFENYKDNYKKIDIQDVYNKVFELTLIIKEQNGELAGNDEIAKSIIDGLILIPNYLSWVHCKHICELIFFDKLSKDTLDYCADKLCSVLSIYTICKDGSGGYDYIIPFFYPTYMVLQYTSEESKCKMMDVLKNPTNNNSKETCYERIVSFYNQHGSINTNQQIQQLKVFKNTSNTSSLRCPICSSTKIKRISTTNRFLSFATVGFASSKIGKQYECKSCKHKW